MRYSLRKAKEGFTLVELMIVVAIIGVLAVLAIYGVRKYIANAKTAEARNSLGQIGKDAATSYEKEGMAAAVLGQGSSTQVLRKLCATGTAGVPTTNAAPKGTKYQSTPADWSGPDAITNVGWPCLKFSMDQPQYYLYNYSTTPKIPAGALNDTFTATANGDLNGDVTSSSFTLLGMVQAGGVLNVAPNLNEVNPEE